MMYVLDPDMKHDPYWTAHRGFLEARKVDPSKPIELEEHKTGRYLIYKYGIGSLEGMEAMFIRNLFKPYIPNKSLEEYM